jgi:hypothetical protein
VTVAGCDVTVFSRKLQSLCAFFMHRIRYSFSTLNVDVINFFTLTNSFDDGFLGEKITAGAFLICTASCDRNSPIRHSKGNPAAIALSLSGTRRQLRRRCRFGICVDDRHLESRQGSVIARRTFFPCRS